MFKDTYEEVINSIEEDAFRSLTELCELGVYGDGDLEKPAMDARSFIDALEVNMDVIHASAFRVASLGSTKADVARKRLAANIDRLKHDALFDIELCKCLGELRNVSSRADKLATLFIGYKYDGDKKHKRYSEIVKRYTDAYSKDADGILDYKLPPSEFELDELRSLIDRACKALAQHLI